MVIDTDILIAREKKLKTKYFAVSAVFTDEFDVDLKLNSFFFFLRNSINEEKEPAQHTSDGHEETRLQNNDPQNSVSAKTSEDNDKEEGHYEELVCLVRQFYVERPINPSAIAYQNIETC